MTTEPAPYSDPDAVPDYARMLRLDGRRFVVLGSGPGLGRQAAHALRANGARVACIDRAPGRADRVASEVSGIGIRADATVREDLEAALGRAEDELSGIDGLVDVIGGNRQQSLLDASDQDWQTVFDLSFRPAVLAVQLGGRAIARAGGGTMAFVSSSLAFTSLPSNAAYSAAKSALCSLVRSAAVEFGPLGIRVNAVAPSIIATPVWFERLGQEVAHRQMTAAARATPTRRVNSPADVAGALLFLSSELSGNISGEIISISGGQHVM